MSLTIFNCNQNRQILISNPLVDGDYADPSIVKHQGKFYIYATKDPRGDEDLAVMESSDIYTGSKKRLIGELKHFLQEQFKLILFLGAHSEFS